MLKIKQHKFILFGIIVLGVILLGMPAVYAGDVQPAPVPVADDALEEIALNREAVIIDLAELWAAESEESVETLLQMLHGATNEQLLTIDEADSYQDVLEALGSTTQDFVYTPVNPCKIVDTRAGGGGFIAANSTRYYNVLGSLGGQGGSFCPSPVGEPRAVHISVTVVDPNGKGNLKVFPYGVSGTTGLQVNFAPVGTNLANAGTTKTNYGGLADIGVKTEFAGCHVTIQVLGYYSVPGKTKVETVVVTASKTVNNNTTGWHASPSCPSGYAVTGGGCHFNHISSGLVINGSRPWDANTWMCQYANTAGFTTGINIHAVCTRVPGR